jgi:hypothetical protein
MIQTTLLPAVNSGESALNENVSFDEIVLLIQYSA